ncbi:hypothetical protein ACIHEJ_38820 [Streptomyces sp. NPDC052301]|uniref:hypothetical protein n=1 Tax=Streptomyces sp. NPDC052301 TaxID=3365687 RepID=UPI0037D6BF00
MSERTAKIVLLVTACGVMWGLVAAFPWIAYVIAGILGTLAWQKAHSWIAARRGSAEGSEVGPGDLSTSRQIWQVEVMRDNDRS